MKCSGIDDEGKPCSGVLELGDRFCSFCGRPLSADLAALSQATPEPQRPPDLACPGCGLSGSRLVLNERHHCTSCGVLCVPLRDNYIIDLGDAAARSDRGRKDDENQDYFLVAKRDVQGKIVKWIVGADGLSQAPEAARAAELACKTISRAIEQEIITGLFDPKKVLARVFAAGNQALLEMSFDRDADHNRGKKLARPMCTVIIILAVDGKPYLCWAGDSPGYGVYSESGQAWAVRFTTDDTVLESLLKQGKSYAEAVKDPRAKEMTQCLGVSNVVPNIAELAPKRLQNLVAIVATTDGPSACFEGQDPLTGKDRPLKLLAQLYLRSFGSAARLVDGLVRIAKDGPAGDNNSAAAIYLQP